MILRSLFLLLLLANLIFFAWANFIDVPAGPAANDSLGRVPRLQLLGEARSQDRPAHPASSPAAQHSLVPAGDPTSGRAAQPPLTQVADTGRCVTVGPFDDPEVAREASALLERHGFTPRSRTEAGATGPGYWVFVAGLESSSQAATALRRLERHGISDAKIMPVASTGGRRISVGLFSQRADAQRRALSVRRLGLDAHIDADLPASVVRWIDVGVGPGTRALPTEDLLSLGSRGPQIEIESCPSRTVGVRPSSTGGKA